MTQGVAPGAGRRFDFERWPCHNARSWHRVVNEARSRSKTSPASSMLGSDADQAVLDIARANAKRAGVGSAIRWHHQRIDALEPPTMHPGLVLTNPPWGRRLGARVGGVYTAFGRVLRERFSGWQLGVLCPERSLIRAMRIPLEPRLRFPHGGTELILWAGTVG